MKNKNIKAICYCRAATDEQLNKEQSKQALKLFTDKNGYNIT